MNHILKKSLTHGFIIGTVFLMIAPLGLAILPIELLKPVLAPGAYYFGGGSFFWVTALALNGLIYTVLLFCIYSLRGKPQYNAQKNIFTVLIVIVFVVLCFGINRLLVYGYAYSQKQVPNVLLSPPTEMHDDTEDAPMPTTDITTEVTWQQYLDAHSGVSFAYASDWLLCPWKLSEQAHSTIFLYRDVTSCPETPGFSESESVMQVSIESELYGGDADYNSHVNRLREYYDDEYNKNFDLHELTIDQHKAVCYNYNSEMGGNGVMYEAYLPTHMIEIAGVGTYGEDCSGASFVRFGELLKDFSE